MRSSAVYKLPDLQTGPFEAAQNNVDWLYDAVRRSVTMAQETVWTHSTVAAQKLVSHKQTVSSFEDQSREAHLIEVHDDTSQTETTDDRYLDLIATLKEVNSKLATIGYAVLDQQGGLKRTRMRSHVRALSQ